MSCSISGEVPTEPVVCTKTGHVFEKSLIEKHINQTGTCPMNKESMSLDDLIPLKSNVSPVAVCCMYMCVYNTEYDDGSLYAIMNPLNWILGKVYNHLSRIYTTPRNICARMHTRVYACKHPLTRTPTHTCTHRLPSSLVLPLPPPSLPCSSSFKMNGTPLHWRPSH